MLRFKNKGFTLIELLVVIAIIGILSSVVLASLNTARGRGNDAKVKAQLAGARSAAELYYDTNGSYSTAANCSTAATMFTDTTSNMSTYVNTANYPASTNIVCGSNGTAYAIKASLNGGAAYWCVDSTGTSKGYAAGWNATSVTVCP